MTIDRREFIKRTGMSLAGAVVMPDLINRSLRKFQKTAWAHYSTPPSVLAAGTARLPVNPTTHPKMPVRPVHRKSSAIWN